MMEIEIGLKKYDVPKHLWGRLFPVILRLERTRDKRSREDAELLKSFIMLRIDSLPLTSYKEWEWKDIRFVSYEIMEQEEDEDEEDDPNPSVESIALREIESKGKRREIEKTAKVLLPYLEETLGVEKLEWLKEFHLLVKQVPLDLFEGNTPLIRYLGEFYKSLKIQNDGFRPYHILPEPVDWNLYLSIRGETPKEHKYTCYWKVLDKALDLKIQKDRRDVARDFLSSHPDLIPRIVERGAVAHPDYPPADCISIVFQEASKIQKRQLESTFREMIRTGATF